MNELERKIYNRLSVDAVNRGLYALQDTEDVEIDEPYSHENFKIPDYEDIAAKEVFGSIIGVLNKKGEIVVEHKFGRIKNKNSRLLTMVFDTDEHAKMFLENEENEKTRLFPNVEHKYLEDKTLIALYDMK